MPDAREDEVRMRVAAAVSRLDPDAESDALAWIEALLDSDASQRRYPELRPAGGVGLSD